MIVIDTSVVIAILLDEPERAQFIELIANQRPVYASAVSFQEAGMVMRSRYGLAGMTDLFDLLVALRISVVAYDEAQARLALDTFDRFGKGIHPKARLNLGDCAADALANFSIYRSFTKGATSVKQTLFPCYEWVRGRLGQSGSAIQVSLPPNRELRAEGE